MGWTWTCFGGRKERLRRLDSDGRVRHRNRLCILVRQERLDTDTQTPTPPNPHSLGAQIRPKSPARDSSVYDEPFQPKQVVCGSLQGSKLFRRKPVRRANSFGSSSFENGAKKSCDKKSSAKTSGETQPEVLVDRLQEEVEALRKRLAEEEAEARKLRNEVCYLRSCGVLQSPERTSCSSIEKDGSSPGSFKDDRGQRHWQSWLGLTLSPASRLKLEDQLRLMAAEEMSKNPGKGLTNGQKALIVASRLWHYQGDPLQASQVKFEHRDSYSSDTSSCFGNNLSQNQHVDDMLPEKDVLPEGSRSRQLSKEAPLPECEEESTLHVASFRDSLDLKFPPGSSIIQEINSENPSSTTSYETENFSFHPSSEKAVIKDVTVIQRATSFPSAASLSAYHKEQLDAEFEKCPPEEQVKFESPRRSCSLPNHGVVVPTSDEARRFIDLRYQELEEKLSRSPKRLSLSSPSATPDRSPPHPLGNALELEDLDCQDALTSPDAKRFPLNKTSPDSADSNSDEDSPASPSTPVMSKPFYSGRTGRVWQPLSPVKEVDSGLSSVPSSEKDASSVFTSQKGLSDSAEGLSMDSWSNESRSSLRSPLSGSERDGHDDASSTPGSNSEAGDVHDDDLFTLSPRTLHRNYDPWEDARNFQGDDNNNAKVDTSVESGTTTDWNSSEDSDFDMLPIQCQSPDLSPKPLRSKFAKENEVKIEYPRDKYFKEMGLKVDEILVSADSTVSSETLSAQKENKKLSESFPAPGAGPPHEISPLSKSSSANDLTLSQDCAHPVLASIENLPKWIEYQGIYVGPPGNKENMQVAAQAVKREEVIQAQRDEMHGNNAAFEPLTSVCTPPASRAEMQRNDIMCARIQHTQDSDLDTHQVQVEKGKPFYFEVSHEKDLLAHNTDENARQVEDKYHRYSPASECQVDEEEGERTCVNGTMGDVIPTPPMQNEVECRSPESGGMDLGKPQMDAHSSTKQAREAEQGGDEDHSSRVQVGEFRSEKVRDLVEKFDFRNGPAVVGQGGLKAHSQVTKAEHVEASAGSDHNLEGLVSDGSVEETESLRESCSSNQLVQSSCVSKDSEVVTSASRGTDETAYSYDSPMGSSPTLLQRRRQSSFSTLIQSADQDQDHDQDQAVEDEANNSDSGGSEKDLYPVYPARGLLSISPDDRPILGTVATWWGDESLSKSRRWWDGQGIPNSTSKYKEDQRVNWHTTPFETRLEQALATQMTVPTEPCDQRNLFDEGVDPVIESADTMDTDVLKPAAPRSEAILV